MAAADVGDSGRGRAALFGTKGHGRGARGGEVIDRPAVNDGHLVYYGRGINYRRFIHYCGSRVIRWLAGRAGSILRAGNSD